MTESSTSEERGMSRTDIVAALEALEQALWHLGTDADRIAISAKRRTSESECASMIRTIIKGLR